MAVNLQGEAILSKSTTVRSHSGAVSAVVAAPFALRCGAFLIDTAEGYATEEIVGLAIKDIRECVFLATKVSPQHLRRSDLLQAADKSLQRMRTDHIDLYQLHYPNYAVPIGETMAAMEKMPPAIYRYQLSRLILGKARSLVPTIIGTRKLPSTAGTDGIRKKNTIFTPCMVNNLL